MSDPEVPLTARYTILSYQAVPLERLSDGNGNTVDQTVLVHAPTATPTIVDVYDDGREGGGYTAMVAMLEPAVRAPTGAIVPAGEMIEAKAQHEAAQADAPKLITPNTNTQEDTTE